MGELVLTGSFRQHACEPRDFHRAYNFCYCRSTSSTSRLPRNLFSYLYFFFAGFGCRGCEEWSKIEQHHYLFLIIHNNRWKWMWKAKWQPRVSGCHWKETCFFCFLFKKKLKPCWPHVWHAGWPEDSNANAGKSVSIWLWDKNWRGTEKKDGRYSVCKLWLPLMF